MSYLMAGFSIVVLAWAAPAPAQAPASSVSIPMEVATVAPSIVAIVSQGPCRVVVVERSGDPISHDVYLQWLREPESPEEPVVVVATRAVSELPAGFWRVSDVKFIDPGTVEFSAHFRFAERPHAIAITFGEAGRYILRGDLTVRADEL